MFSGMINSVEIELGTDDASDCSESEARLRLTMARQEGMIEYARQLNAMRKIVFSKTLSHVEWNNSVLLHEIDQEEIAKMKQEAERDMVIYGSASIVQRLTNLNLIDRHQLLVFPIVLGSGRPLFHDISHKVKLSLVNARTYPSGVVELSYQLVKD